MSSAPARSSKTRTKSQQPKISDFGSTKSNMEANANATGDATAEKSEEVEGIKSE